MQTNESSATIEFLPHYRRAASELRTSGVRSGRWQSIYMELMWSMELLLRRIATDSKVDIGDRWTLGHLRSEIGGRKIMPSVLYHSLDVLINHRNVVVHAHVPYDSDARDYLADLDAVRNIAIWYLMDFESGPRLSRSEAENLLNESPPELVQKTKTIFLSYAREDEQKAVEIYEALKSRGHKPWMDKKKLLGGQDWQSEIRRAIERSQYFIALLSRESVSKRGFVQKEIRFALDVLGEIPPGQIYFIPVRLEPCEVPDAIRSLQWIDISSHGDYEELFRSIEL